MTQEAIEEEDDDFTQDGEGVEEAKPQTPSSDPAKEVARLKEKNRQLTFRLHKSEIEAKYGSQIADLIPELLPFKDWDPFAEKLIALRGTAVVAPEAAEEEEAQPPPTPTEQALAAVSSSSPATSQAPETTLSAKEIGELYAKNPAEAMKLMSRYPTE